MPIFGLTDSIELEVREKEDNSIVPHFDSERTDDSILVTLPGLKWKVTYFNRRVDDASSITTYDPNINITLQEFNRYNNFIINVDSPLPTGVQDDITGSGILDVNFTPTPNDVFLTNLPDGKIAIYTITSVARINYNNKHLYKVEYSLYMAVSDITDPIYVHLLQSTDNEFYYNENFRLEQDKDVLDKEEYVVRKEFYRYIDKLIAYYGTRFVTRDTDNLIGYSYTEDDIKHNVYDPYMVTFIKNTIGISNLPNVELTNVKKDKVSILDLIIDSNISIDLVDSYNVTITKSTYGINPYLYPILYSNNITEVIGLDSINDIVSNNTIIDSYFPAIDTKRYIFRNVVYDKLNNTTNETTLTTFERLVIDMLNGIVIDKEELELLYSKLYHLPVKEQFYFIPIFIYILRYYITTFTVKYV